MNYTHAILVDADDMSVTPKTLSISSQLSERDINTICSILDAHEVEPLQVVGSLIVERDSVAAARRLARWFRENYHVFLLTSE